ncbi:MAG: holo-ACP synthase [bacterium]|nr:holo-ACP synthase [bacterium]
MIYGLGIDLVEINRMRETIERFGERFLERVFTKNEIGYCQTHKDKYEHLAARFAAKEALLKAISVGWPKVSFRDVEVVNTRSGSPKIGVYGRAKDLLDKLNLQNISLTISHTKDYATAVVIIEVE